MPPERERAILEAGATLRRLLRVRLDEDEQFADYGTDLSEEAQRAMEARISEQQNALDAWDRALGAVGEGR